MASALISAVVIGLSGCVGADPKPVVTQLTPIKQVVVTLPENDPLSTNKLHISNINITSQLQVLSGYKKYRRYKCPSYCNYRGLLITKHNNLYRFDYTRETIYGHGKRSIKKQNHTVFDMPFSIKDNTLTFNFPSTSKKELISSLGYVGSPIGSDNLKVNRKSLPLYVEVFPYRGFKS